VPAFCPVSACVVLAGSHLSLIIGDVIEADMTVL